MNQSDARVPYRAGGPGELMRLVAGRLEAHGLGVRLPEWEDERRLCIERGGDLVVDDCGQVRWECVPRAHDKADPRQIADVAAILLTGQAADRPRQDGTGREPPGLTLKGVVGRDLLARGFGVDLEIVDDSEQFDLFGEIVVTSPDAGPDASVRISDDGDITWERDYWPDAAARTQVPGDLARLTGPGDLADSIAAVVARVLPLAAAIATGSQARNEVSGAQR